MTYRNIFVILNIFFFAALLHAGQSELKKNNERLEVVPVTPPALFSPSSNAKNEDTTVIFVWEKRTQFTSYMLQVSEDSSFASILVDSLTKNSFLKIGALQHNKTYYWRVKGIVSDSVQSMWSLTFNFGTNLSAPVPTGPNGNNQDSVVTFSWQNVAGADFYLLQISKTPGFEQSNLIYSSYIDSNPSLVNQLESNIKYYWRISAINFNGGTSGWSGVNNFEIKLLPVVLALPVNQSRNIDTVRIFNWGRINGAAQYRFALSDDSLFANIKVDTVFTDTSLKISVLKYFNRNYWKVYGISSDGNSGYWSNVNTFATRLATPIVYSPANNSYNHLDTVELGWSQILGASKYHLQVYADSVGNLMIDTLISQTSFYLKNLKLNAEYFWRVIGFNEQSDSSLWMVMQKFQTKFGIILSSKIITDTVTLAENSQPNVLTAFFENYSTGKIKISNAFSSPDSLFTFAADSIAINAGKTDSIFVAVNPFKAKPGINSGEVNFIKTDSLGLRDTLNLKLSVFVFKAKADFSPDTLNFGVVKSDSATDKLISLRNFEGNYKIKIKRIYFLDPDSASFTLLNRPTEVLTDNSNSISIEYIPAKLGNINSTLVLETDASPQSIFKFHLLGIGRGGKLSAKSLTDLTSINDSTFEALTSGDKTIYLKNEGNEPLSISNYFVKYYFTVLPGSAFYLNILPGDSVKVTYRYLIPNFNHENIDTLKIHQNGVGKKNLTIILKGIFDSTASIGKLLRGLKINGQKFNPGNFYLYKDSTVFFSIDSTIAVTLFPLEFHYKYFVGGSDSTRYPWFYSHQTFYISGDDISDRGIIVSCKMFTRDVYGVVTDSINLFKDFSPRILLHGYSSERVKIPRSIPAQSAGQVNTKWVMFGVPFDSVNVDSVFGYFGGRKTMQDGEWVVYKYDASTKSFALFNDQYFEPQKAYFFAQSLLDTFNISYNINSSIFARSLTDTAMSLPGNIWKTVSDPYTFDVQVQPPAMLYKYDYNKNSYSLTNIMKPGEGYFVAPEVNVINFKTYGKYEESDLPDIITQNQWHMDLNIKDYKSSNNLTFSILNRSVMQKAGVATQLNYEVAPNLSEGLESYIQGSINGGKNKISVASSLNGAGWNIILKNNYSDDEVVLAPALQGQLPENYRYILYDSVTAQKYEKGNLKLNLAKGEKRVIKLLVGTDEYINNILAQSSLVLPTEFNIAQNFPNPFNPSTTIRYSVPKKSFVKIKVYNILGAEVATLVDKEEEAGNYGIIFNAANLASGVYIYRIEAGNFVSSKKMILLK